MKPIQIAALAVLAAFYTAYFAKMLLQRRRGVKTNHIFKGGKPRRVLVTELLMEIAVYAVVVAEAVSIIWDFRMWSPPLAWAGIGIASLGVLVFITAMATMRDSWRAGIPEKDKTELVTTGIYRISRNPAFLGFDLMYLGVLIAFFNFPHLLLALFAVVMLHLQILQEERFLAEAFGGDYAGYKRNVYRYFGRKAKSRRKRIIISVICVLLAVPLVVMPLATAMIYESIFGTRYETASWMEFSAEDYEGLRVERSDFRSGDVTLAGYKYSKAGQDVKGVVVIAHGLGGGHNTYMPFADCFTSSGYYVFAYDARGNDNSGGDSVEGLPQGLADLDNAIRHTAAIEEYRDLPVVLFGHSWGAYSAGSVLNMHPDVRAAVIVAGCNESEDLLRHYGAQMAGAGIDVFMPYLKLYERLKFGGGYASASAVGGMEKTDAGIMVVHSRDDETVPAEYGYDKFYEAFGDSDRFEFVLYEDRGHNYLFYSEASLAYQERLNADYKSYVEDSGGEYSEETKAEFMNGYLDRKKCFEPDPVLMGRILEMYDTYCEG